MKREPPGESGPRAYHHGDLRRRLIDVGEGLLEESGVAGFTLRECARRAGVSPSAPSHHFGNVTGLLTAIATLGFDGLAEAQESALVGSEGGPSDRVGRISGAYVRYAVAHPARFRVIFGRIPLDEADPSLLAASSRALGVLKRELAAIPGLAPDGAADHREFDAAVAFVWSTVHGYATLLIDGYLPVIDPDLDHQAYLGDLAGRVIERLARSFESRAATTSTGPAPSPRGRRKP